MRTRLFGKLARRPRGIVLKYRRVDVTTPPQTAGVLPRRLATWRTAAATWRLASVSGSQAKGFSRSRARLLPARVRLVLGGGVGAGQLLQKLVDLAGADAVALAVLIQVLETVPVRAVPCSV